MIILEKSKNGIISIWRFIRTSNDYGRFNKTEIESVFINSFDSIDCDGISEILIIVNSNCQYKINLESGKTQDFISSIIKSEIRDEKINSILT